MFSNDYRPIQISCPIVHAIHIDERHEVLGKSPTPSTPDLPGLQHYESCISCHMERSTNRTHVSVTLTYHLESGHGTKVETKHSNLQVVVRTTTNEIEMVPQSSNEAACGEGYTPLSWGRAIWDLPLLIGAGKTIFYRLFVSIEAHMNYLWWVPNVVRHFKFMFF